MEAEQDSPDPLVATGQIRGFKVGVSVVLMVWMLWDSLVDPPLGADFWHDPALRIYRGLGNLILLLWMWLLSVFLWPRYGINYAKLLNLGGRKTDLLSDALDLSIAFLVSLICFYKAIRGVFLKAVSPSLAHLFPLALLLFVLYKATTPWDARKPVFTAVIRVLLAPFGESVTFCDGYVGDILTSLVRVLIDLAFTVLFFAAGIKGWATDRTHISEDHISTTWFFQHAVVPMLTVRTDGGFFFSLFCAALPVKSSRRMSTLLWPLLLFLSGLIYASHALFALVFSWLLTFPAAICIEGGTSVVALLPEHPKGARDAAALAAHRQRAEVRQCADRVPLGRLAATAAQQSSVDRGLRLRDALSVHVGHHDGLGPAPDPERRGEPAEHPHQTKSPRRRRQAVRLRGGGSDQSGVEIHLDALPAAGEGQPVHHARAAAVPEPGHRGCRDLSTDHVGHLQVRIVDMREGVMRVIEHLGTWGLEELRK
eukprot:scaffold69_cov248-Pinguiococcus_pyrenoidosus.AAC.29